MSACMKNLISTYVTMLHLRSGLRVHVELTIDRVMDSFGMGALNILLNVKLDTKAAYHS